MTGEDQESPVTLRVQLLTRFGVLLPDGRRAGPWVRPTARRLVQLLSVREEHRIGREEAAELLFADLSPAGAANGVAKALSMARTAIGPVGPGGVPALVADRASIWVHDAVRLRSDLDEIHGALRAASDLIQAVASCETYYACVNNSSGTIKVVAGADDCKTGDYFIEWNAQGPQGEIGPAGPQGEIGPQGPQGRTGGS